MNHIVALDFGKILSASKTNIANSLKDIVKDQTGYNFEELISSAKQDVAAIKAAEHLMLDKEACNMH